MLSKRVVLLIVRPALFQRFLPSPLPFTSLAGTHRVCVLFLLLLLLFLLLLISFVSAEALNSLFL